MNKELEKAKKVFGNIDIENEEVLKKAYRKLVRMYSENVEDEEKFKEVNLARDSVKKYIKKYQNDTKKLNKIYTKKKLDLKEEESYLGEITANIKAIQKVIKVTKKTSSFYNIYRKIHPIFLVIVAIISFFVILKNPTFLFIFTILYALFFNFVIKASKQKQVLSSLLRERRFLKKEIEGIEKKIHDLKIELYAVEIALESVDGYKKVEQLLIEKKEKTA